MIIEKTQSIYIFSRFRVHKLKNIILWVSEGGGGVGGYAWQVEMVAVARFALGRKIQHNKNSAQEHGTQLLVQKIPDANYRK